MSVITFWNNSKRGNIGQTASMIATATSMAIEHNYKVLVISTQLGDFDLEKAYGVQESGTMKFLGIKESKFDSGIEGVMKLASSGKLSPELINNYTKIVLKGNRLEVLSGKKENKDDETEKFDFNKYPEIIKIANRYYDMIFVDLDRGLQKDMIKKVLEVSNIIIWNMEQKFEIVEEVINFQKEDKLLSKNNVLYLFNRYEKNSKYNVKNIVRNSTMKKKIFTIPYDIMFGDTIQDGTIDQWFLNPKIRRATMEEEHGFFISEINKLTEGIIYKLQELHMLG